MNVTLPAVSKSPRSPLIISLLLGKLQNNEWIHPGPLNVTSLACSITIWSPTIIYSRTVTLQAKVMI